MAKYLMLAVAMLGIGQGMALAADEAEDTPVDLAKRYLEATQKKDKDAITKLWVTQQQLATFLDSPAAAAFPIPKERRAGYVAESMKQQTRRLADQLKELERTVPAYEIVEAKPGRILKGLVCERVDLKLRDPATQKERQSSVHQESIKIDGRWYFFERP